jgi:glycolate oxidase subunit GlcD
MPISASFLARCRSLLGAPHVLTSAADLSAYDSDGLSFHRYRAEAVVLPGSSEELKVVLALARMEDAPYTLRGAGTGLSGGAVPAQGGLLLHLSRLKKIVQIDPENLMACVEPGVVLQALNKALEPHGLFYPPDPSSGFACTLGGNVAENAGGIRCFKYGVTANYVLGLEVVTPEGDHVTLGGPAGGLGPALGANWKALFVGSEGLLGCIVKIWLRLKPIPDCTRTILATFPNLETASAAIVGLVHHPSIPVAAELMDSNMIKLVEASPFRAGLDPAHWALLCELNGPRKLVEAVGPSVEAMLLAKGAATIKGTEDALERQKLWKARKVGGGLTGQVSPDVMVQDAVIPRSRLAEVLTEVYALSDAAGVPVINLFHAGDGNLHPNFMFDSRIPGETEKVKALGKALMQKVIAVGGTLSGEHGIGNDKMDYMPLLFGPREIALQEAVVLTFNPQNQLNPNKVLPNRSYVGCCTPGAAHV